MMSNASTANHAVEIQGLVKRYGSNNALDGLNLAVPRGAVAGFVGLNGAGKTTTLRILLQMAKGDAGTAHVLGLDVSDREQSVQIRRRTAFVPERKDLFPYMSVGDVIAFTKSFYPKWRDDLQTQYLRDFGLRTGQKITQLSKGMLTKLHLLLALSRGAELILLDEPTDGLDPLGVEVAMQALVGLAAEEGVTVLFSSHRLNEMEQVADYLCVIHRGKAMMTGYLDDLKAECRRLVMVFDSEASQQARSLADAGSIRQDGRTLTLLARTNAEQVRQRAEAMGARSVEVHTLSLREMFLELVKGDTQ